MYDRTLANIAHDNFLRPQAIDVALEEAVAVAQTRGRALNCVVGITEDAARSERLSLAGRHTQGLLHGVILAHKDMFDRSGQLCEWGSPLREGYRASQTATVLQRLATAGAIDMARLHMAELALGLTGHNGHLGRCLNPLSPERISGGSSSGSAAGVGAGLVRASLGSDTGGSIRIPAGACGIVGLKPGWGRVPMDGCMPLAPSLDCIGPLAASVADCARIFDIMADGAVDSPGAAEQGLLDVPGRMRVAWPKRYYRENVETSVARALDDWRGAMERHGWTFSTMELPGQDSLASANGSVLGYEAARTHAQAMQDCPNQFGTQVMARLRSGEAVDPAHYRHLLEQRPLRQRAFVDAVFGDADILATPLLRIPVPTGNETAADTPDRIARILGEIGRNVRPFSYLGLPALVVPVGLDINDMPVAIQLVGPWGSEPALLRAGLVVERAMAFRPLRSAAQGISGQAN